MHSVSGLFAIRKLGLKADFHSVEFSNWAGIPLFTCENVAFNLKRILCMNNNLLCQIQSAQKILPSGNQSEVLKM